MGLGELQLGSQNRDSSLSPAASQLGDTGQVAYPLCASVFSPSDGDDDDGPSLQDCWEDEMRYLKYKVLISFWPHNKPAINVTRASVLELAPHRLSQSQFFFF